MDHRGGSGGGGNNNRTDLLAAGRKKVLRPAIFSLPFGYFRIFF
jgi:hypothetical protein